MADLSSMEIIPGSRCLCQPAASNVVHLCHCFCSVSTLIEAEISGLLKQYIRFYACFEYALSIFFSGFFRYNMTQANRGNLGLGFTVNPKP